MIEQLFAPELAALAKEWIAPFRFDGGRIVEAWGIEDTLARREQLGLR